MFNRLKALLTVCTLISGVVVAADSYDARPKILVRGWGPASYTNFSTFKTFLAKDGVDKEIIHEISYNYGGSREAIMAEVGEKIKKALASYPSRAQVDVFAHSLGSISSLLAIVSHGLHPQIHKYVSITGIEFGQERYPANCSLGWACGSIFRWIIPFKNKPLMQWHADHAAELSFSKCAVWTQNDSLLTPKNAGVHAGSPELMVKGISHVDIIRSERVYQQIKEVCFAGE